MAVQTTQADTFAALDACFTADLAALIGSEPPRSLTPIRFIDLVEEVRDVLADSRLGHLQEASDDLDSAAGHLTDALTSPAGDRSSLLAWARTHLRDAIAAAS
ncbi:hypothetical protein AB0O64_32430 [Streptomyces sp. NPDC088341]|uniref:hypothetical protein n=1 Tax=Streptomyces sp. NPDC088341 TaxID=3154870 RepID=UPI00341330CC